MISLAAEIPNDNPRLHRGARWVCTELTGPARVLLPRAEPIRIPAPRESAVVPSAARDGRGTREPDAPVTLADLVAAVALLEDPSRDGLRSESEDEPVVVEELEPLDADVSVEGVAAEAPAADVTAVDPYRAFVRVLVDVALARNDPAAAACVEELFDGRTPLRASADVAALLAAGDILGDAQLSTTFETRRSAWREILCGIRDDFEACGPAMLDDWAADVLARALGVLAQQPALKRELRARGIAAFGLVDVAA